MQIPNKTEIILWRIMTIVSLLIVLYYKLSFGSIYKLNSLLLNIAAGTSIIGICGWIYINAMIEEAKSRKLNQELSTFKFHYNLGIISLLIFFISFFLPFYKLGSNGVTLWYILTEIPNNDLIGIFLLFVGGAMLVTNANVNLIKIVTIIGVLFPIYRFYKIVSVGDIGSSYLQPSFGIGGVLILIGAGIQLYACYNTTINFVDIFSKSLETTHNENSSDGITEKIEKLSNLKDKGALTEEEFDTKKKELLDRI
jgi:hypothetical protein